MAASPCLVEHCVLVVDVPPLLLHLPLPPVLLAAHPLQHGAAPGGAQQAAARRHAAAAGGVGPLDGGGGGDRGGVLLPLLQHAQLLKRHLKGGVGDEQTAKHGPVGASWQHTIAPTLSRSWFLRRFRSHSTRSLSKAKSELGPTRGGRLRTQVRNYPTFWVRK